MTLSPRGFATSRVTSFGAQPAVRQSTTAIANRTSVSVLAQDPWAGTRQAMLILAPGTRAAMRSHAAGAASQGVTQAAFDRAVAHATGMVPASAEFLGPACKYAVAYTLLYGLGTWRPDDTMREMAEINMIELQDLMARRANLLQLMTGLLNSIDQSMKTIMGNIR